ncbi:hypothetical protein D3C74_408420 [compost metagenome]
MRAGPLPGRRVVITGHRPPGKINQLSGEPAHLVVHSFGMQLGQLQDGDIRINRAVVFLKGTAFHRILIQLLQTL